MEIFQCSIEESQVLQQLQHLQSFLTKEMSYVHLSIIMAHSDFQYCNVVLSILCKREHRIRDFLKHEVISYSSEEFVKVLKKALPRGLVLL